MYEEIVSLHKKYAPSDTVYDLVFTHCRIVRDIALQLIADNHLSVDRDLVVTGALLHDIGVHPLFGVDSKLRRDVNYITHGTDGEMILRNEGYPEYICRFASHHTGVGLSRDDIVTQKLPLPQKDYLAENDEELLVMYADKFHSKTTPPYFNSYEWYKEYISRFGLHKSVAFKQMAYQFGKPDLRRLQAEYGFEIR